MHLLLLYALTTHNKLYIKQKPKTKQNFKELSEIHPIIAFLT